MSGDGYGSERPVGTFTQWVENRNADDQLVKSLEEAFEKEGEKQNDVPPEPEKPEDSKKDPPKAPPQHVFKLFCKPTKRGKNHQQMFWGKLC